MLVLTTKANSTDSLYTNKSKSSNGTESWLHKDQRYLIDDDIRRKRRVNTYRLEEKHLKVLFFKANSNMLTKRSKNVAPANRQLQMSPVKEIRNDDPDWAKFGFDDDSPTHSSEAT